MPPEVELVLDVVPELPVEVEPDTFAVHEPDPNALIGFLHYFAHDPMTALLTGMGSGLAPYLARYACHDWLNMDLELRNLTPGKLLAISVVFAVMSASLQQAVLLWRGYTDHFAQDTFVMASGDLLGTIIVIYLAKLTILAVGAGLKSR